MLLVPPIKEVPESEPLRTSPRGLRLSRNVGVRNAHFLDQRENMPKIAASFRLDTRQSIPRGQVAVQFGGSRGIAGTKPREKASNTQDAAEFQGHFSTTGIAAGGSLGGQSRTNFHPLTCN